MRPTFHMCVQAWLAARKQQVQQSLLTHKRLRACSSNLTFVLKISPPSRQPSNIRVQARLAARKQQAQKGWLTIRSPLRLQSAYASVYEQEPEFTTCHSLEFRTVRTSCFTCAADVVAAKSG
eukprot:1161850-Pelagomonas_calceolata.AAC.12